METPVKSKVLIVDDETSIRELLGIYLRREGYEVLEAATGTEARQQVGSNSPALTILDIVLPDCDGIQLLDEFGKNYPHMPVIILTGIGFDEEVNLEAREHGAAGYVSKSLPLETLLQEVRRILTLSNPPA
jgi:DNA-binding response OmpR family regulator